MAMRWLVVWLAVLSVAGCDNGSPSPGAAGDAGARQPRPGVDGGVGDTCESPEDCTGVKYPECVELGAEGATRCQSVCEQHLDCSADADCVAVGEQGEGACLLPCDADADCPTRWDCILDARRIGYCWPPEDTSHLSPINAACGADEECGARFGICFDWGDDAERCASACLDHGDCGSGDNLCVAVDPDTDEALCFQVCAETADCPAGWDCEEATASGKRLCLPPEG